MRRSISVGVWLPIGSLLLLISFFPSATHAATTYHCNNVTERTSADFEGIQVDRVCKEYVGPPSSQVSQLNQSCLDPSTGTGQWAEGACDKGWVAACSVKSIGPATLKTPFTQYTYKPTGGNMTNKQIIEIARQQCQIMSFGSGKFVEAPEDKITHQVVSQGAPEGSTGKAAGASSVDPAFKDYEYPDADFDGTFSMGNTVSVSYFSQDDFSKVVEFYNQKFSGAAIQSGTTTHFAKTNPDGSYLSATITQVGDKTQIILKLEK